MRAIYYLNCWNPLLHDQTKEKKEENSRPQNKKVGKRFILEMC